MLDGIIFGRCIGSSNDGSFNIDELRNNDFGFVIKDGKIKEVKQYKNNTWTTYNMSSGADDLYVKKIPYVLQEDNIAIAELTPDYIMVELDNINIQLDGTTKQVIKTFLLPTHYKQYYKMPQRIGRYYLPNTFNQVYLTLELSSDLLSVDLVAIASQNGLTNAFRKYCNRLLFTMEHI